MNNDQLDAIELCVQQLRERVVIDTHEDVITLLYAVEDYLDYTYPDMEQEKANIKSLIKTLLIERERQYP